MTTGSRVPGPQRLRQLAGVSLLASVALTPLYSFGEVSGLISGTMVDQVTAATPAPIKAIKDIFNLLIVAFTALAMLLDGRINRLTVPFGLFAMYAIAAAAWSYSIDPLVAAGGLRWVLPFMLCWLLIDTVDERLLGRLSLIVSVLFVGHFVAQVAELFLIRNFFYGSNVFGLAGRVPGMFFIPNTAAYFAVIAVYLAYFYPPPSLLRRSVFLLAAPSVFLTQSGVAIIALGMVWLVLVAGPRRLALIAPVAIVGAGGLLAVLGVVTGRANIAYSGLRRLQLFTEVIVDGSVLPTKFGYATNTAVGLVFSGFSAAGENAVKVLDSTFAQIIGNLGLLGFFAFVLFAGAWVLSLIRVPRLDAVVLTLICALFAASTSVTETFPMNLIVAAAFAHLFRVHFLPFWEAFAHPSAALAPSHTRG